MAENYPKLSSLVLDEESITLALNEEYVQTGEVIDLRDGDTIALIPPISGGWGNILSVICLAGMWNCKVRMIEEGDGIKKYKSWCKLGGTQVIYVGIADKGNLKMETKKISGQPIVHSWVQQIAKKSPCDGMH